MGSIYVRIVGKHPHAGECGHIAVSDDDTVTVETLADGKRRVVVKLEDCPHGVQSCYISPGDIQVIREPGH